ncbi:hypothetical protein DFR38_11126 [Aquitalea magnusonii]|uniref:Uncharacterized protein n=1 Tax=Aquitalea magnusonii TaxID=332411 RepID=A0A318JNP7_9NEIS|nr:hypothetical protein DFR38_11126 [Aquitalea magnusonii]
MQNGGANAPPFCMAHCHGDYFVLLSPRGGRLIMQDGMA